MIFNRCKLCKHWTPVSTTMGSCEELSELAFDDLQYKFAYSKESSKTKIYTPKFAICAYFTKKPITGNINKDSIKNKVTHE